MLTWETLHYAYRHSVTEATTGYFSCEPDPELSFAAALQRLAATPMDEFLHRHVLHALAAQSPEELQAMAATSARPPSANVPECADAAAQRAVLTALLLECAVLNPALHTLRQHFGPHAVEQSLPYTPLPYLAWSLLPQGPLQSRWSELFAANTTQHQQLPHPDEEALPLLYPEPLPDRQPSPPTLAALHAALKSQSATPWQRPPAQETALRALTLLLENDILAGAEMRHEASLSPIALLRPWQLELHVCSGPLNYSLRGQATTYGRGLSLADARASYAMEMIERASAYATVDDNAVLGRSRHTPLFKAKYSQLLAEGRAALDPNMLPLEAPYRDTALYWMEALEAQSGREVLVPAQSVFLFCNLDEPALFMAGGSTGLASGNSLAEAKVAALTEILERDAETVMPYDRCHCFTLRSQDARLQSLLDDYAARGVHVHFLDLTTEFGVPCYQAFVMGRKGDIFRATGAGLKGSRAALAALTEVPYPYPASPPSGPALKGLPQRVLEELPDYSLESPSRNLTLLENTLCAHGHRPLYVEITRQDLEFPVVRALVPGLELMPEQDTFSAVSSRQFANYRRLWIR